MTSDVVLTSALRANLLSLQNTQGLVDITQNRLATGKKVNSALDGPQAFFASQALTNRASDLSRLLDSIGQSIQVIKAADNGVTALTRLIEQADSVAASARDALAQGQVEAKVTGSRDLRNINDLTSLPGIAPGDSFVMEVTDENGAPIFLGTYGAAAAATATVTINANDSIEDLVTQINNLHLNDGTGQALGVKAFEASLNDKGQLVIKTVNGGDFRVNFTSLAGTDAGNLALAADLGMADVARLVADGAANSNNVEFSAVSDVALVSYALYDNTVVPPRIAPASTRLSNVTNESGATPRFANIDNAADQYIISINGSAQQAISLWDGANARSIQSIVDQINTNTALNTKLKASYDDTTGELRIRPIDSSVKSIEIGVSDAVTANFGFGINPALTGLAGVREMESIRLAASAADLANFENDFDNLREQIDQLVSNNDTGYRGTNLLFGDDLTTFFNEDRSSRLETQGVIFTADGLGINAADFARVDTSDAALEEVRQALGVVRGFGSTLANDLSIIQTRENYTKDMINTLTEGSDKLVNADQNEEGAKLLALQTRQSLGVTALSLASQSQQSILRLFG